MVYCGRDTLSCVFLAEIKKTTNNERKRIWIVVIQKEKSLITVV